MKKINLLSLLCVLFLFASCDTSNKSVGLSNWSDDGKVYKWHLGTENAVDVAINVDKAMQSRDYTLLRNFLSDTVRITASNGVSYDLDSFITRRNEIDSIVDSRLIMCTPFFSRSMYGLKFGSHFLVTCPKCAPVPNKSVSYTHLTLPTSDLV